MIELRPLTAEIALMTGVASGLVVGASAPMTPIGLAILTIWRSGSSSMMPTDLSPMMSYSVARVFLKILRNLPSVIAELGLVDRVLRDLLGDAGLGDRPDHALISASTCSCV
jgi:hypothetical protein